MSQGRVIRGPHGTVYISSGDSRGPYRTYDQFRALADGMGEHPGIAAGYARLAANPLKPTKIVEESQARERANKARGGRSGYDW